MHYTWDLFATNCLWVDFGSTRPTYHKTKPIKIGPTEFGYLKEGRRNMLKIGYSSL